MYDPKSAAIRFGVKGAREVYPKGPRTQILGF